MFFSDYRFYLSVMLFLPLSAKSAVITAASASSADIQTAAYSVHDGDELDVPAGSPTWTTGIIITNGIWLHSLGGTNNLIITDNVNGYAITWTYTGSYTSQMDGFQFSGGNSAFRCVYILGANTNTCRWRIFNNKCFMAPDFLKFDTVLGCVDHNYIFCNPPGNKFAHVKDSTWNGWLEGNGAWSNATPLMGTEQFIFFESNTIVCTNLTFLTSLIDSQAGARYVFRFNQIFGAGYVEAHGSEASYERSTHAREIYGNTFWMSNVNQICTYSRGGVDYIFSNNISDVSGVGSCLKLLDNRMNDSLFAPFGGADGNNHWDKNNAGNPFATGTCASSGANSVTVVGSPYTAHQYIGYTVVKTSGKAVSSITRVGTTMTVTCVGHGFSSGNLVSIFGADQQEYNSLYNITSTGTDTFTCDTSGSAPTTPATGTIKACLGNYFAEITDNTVNTITYNSSIYGTPTMAFTAGDTFKINLVDQPMDGCGHIGGSLIDSTATPSFPATWNDQTTKPCYQWQNNGGNQGGVAWSSSSGTIVIGTHAINDIAAPFYTPFGPHPLDGGAGGGGGGGQVSASAGRYLSQVILRGVIVQ